MKRGLGVTIALVVCLIVQFAGLFLFSFVNVPEAPYRPIYWACVAVSGFAAVISALLAERAHSSAWISGAIGAFLFGTSVSALIPH